MTRELKNARQQVRYWRGKCYELSNKILKLEAQIFDLTQYAKARYDKTIDEMQAKVEDLDIKVKVEKGNYDATVAAMQIRIQELIAACEKYEENLKNQSREQFRQWEKLQNNRIYKFFKALGLWHD